MSDDQKRTRGEGKAEERESEQGSEEKPVTQASVHTAAHNRAAPGRRPLFGN